MAKKDLVLEVKLLDKLATIPTKAYEGDAGWDLYAIKKETIPTNTVRTINTGIAVAIPEGYYGQICERSGFSMSNTLKVKAGVIDSGYRGEIKIIFQNCGDYPALIDAGTKVAQLVLLPVPNITLNEVTELSETARGEKGFGSSDTTKSN